MRRSISGFSCWIRGWITSGRWSSGAAAWAGLTIVGATAVFGACGGIVEVDHLAEGGGGMGGAGTTVSSTTASGTTMVSNTSTTTSISSTSSSTSTTTSSSSSGTGGGPAIPPIIEVSLGTHPLGQPASFDVPAGILGFTLKAKPSSPGHEYDILGIEDLVAPNGTPTITDYKLASNTHEGFLNYGIAVAAVPQSDAPPAMPVMPGTWTYTLGNFGFPGIDNADVTLYYRQTVDDQFHGGVIDVNAFIAGGIVDVDTFGQALKTAYDGFAGLSLGKVTFYSLPDKYLQINDTKYLEVLEETKVASGAPALNIIVVESLNDLVEGAAGVTPGAPAMAMEHGTHASGLIVTFWNDPGIDTMILRHEAGHFGGLYHTSEFTAGLGDALSDTPLCADVNAQFETCPDYPNLMFPTGGDMSYTLSAKQNTTLQGSLFYRGIVSPGGAPLVLPGDDEGADAPSFIEADLAERWEASALPSGHAWAKSAWATSLSPTAVAALSAVACGVGQGEASVLATGLQGVPTLDLLAIGAEATAPVYVRHQALFALRDRQLSAREQAALLALVTRPDLPTRVRLGAFSAAERAVPHARSALLSAAAADSTLQRWLSR